MIDYLQEKKITFGAWKQSYVDIKRRSTWNASSHGGQVSNVLNHHQKGFGWLLLENIRNIGPVPTYPWHQLASVSPILYVPAVTKSGVLGNSGSDSGVLESIRCGWGWGSG